MDNGFSNPAFNLQQMSQPRQDMSAQMTQQQQKKPWWTSLISEIGGAGGLAAGAAFAPETGGLSLLIPAAGAAIGSFGGRVAENKVRDNRLGLGDAAKESAISGLTAGVAGGYDAYKASKAAQGLTDVAKGAESAIQVPDKVGLLESIGRSIKSGASGFGIGAKVPGEQQLTAEGSDAIGNTLSKLGIGSGAPESQARTIGEKISNLNNILTSKYAAANATVTPEELNNLGSKILGRVTETPGLGDSANKFALDEAQKLVKTGDVNGLWDYVKGLSRNSANFASSGDAKLADKEGAARAILDETRGFLNGKVPGLAETNNLYHNAKTAESFLLGAAKDTKGGGLISKVANLAPVKAVESRAGGLLENVGKATAGTATGSITGPASDMLRALKIGSPAALARGLGGPQQPQNPQDLLQPGGPSQPAPDQDATGSLLGQANQGGDVTSQLLGQPQRSQSGGPSMDTLKQAIAQDIQQTGGKNMNNLMQLGQLYGLVDSSGSPAGAKLTTDQQKTVDSANEASATLDTMLSQLGQLGGGAGRVGGLLGTIEGKVGLNNNVNAFNSTKTDTAIALAKAYSGSARIPSKEQLQSIEQSMPNYNDNPQEAQRKVDLIKQRLSAKLGSIPGGGAASSISNGQGLLSQLNGY